MAGKRPSLGSHGLILADAVRSSHRSHSAAEPQPKRIRLGDTEDTEVTQRSPRPTSGRGLGRYATAEIPGSVHSRGENGGFIAARLMISSYGGVRRRCAPVIEPGGRGTTAATCNLSFDGNHRREASGGEIPNRARAFCRSAFCCSAEHRSWNGRLRSRARNTRGLHGALRMTEQN